MGKASSTKKIARVARAGNSSRAGQRRPMGFGIGIAGLVLAGLGLVLFTRSDRITNAAPRASSDHWHVAYNIYTCVPDSSTPVLPTTTTTSSTTTTAPKGATTTSSTTTTTSTTAPTPTTLAAPGDVPGEYLPNLLDPPGKEDVLGLHTHGDGVIHVHPFASAAAGRKATLGNFLRFDDVVLNDTTFILTTAKGTMTFQEGKTKCAGGKDGILQVAEWDRASDAAKGDKPNRIVTDGVADVRLRNGQALTIAFLPKDSTIPSQNDVQHRLDNLTDVAATTTAPPSSSSSGSSGSSSSSSSGSGGSTTTTAPPVSSSSSAN